MKRIYLDYAASTPTDPRVERVILKCDKFFANPSSLHQLGREAKKILDASRIKVANVLNCRPEEMVFTSSGTEADNLVILGAAQANRSKGMHIIVSTIEHDAVLSPALKLRDWGYTITQIPVNKNGVVDAKKVIEAIRPDTILISIQYANSEIGTIQPIKEIAKGIKDLDVKPIFHTDASQAAGFLNLNVQQLGVDSMTLNSSKIYGPKGVGCLFVRRGTLIAPIMYGGGQERGLRPGTESPALVAGFAEALSLANKNKTKESSRIFELQGYLIKELKNNFPDIVFNGDIKEKLPNNINVSFPNQDGEMLVLKLDRYGICVSTGSACSSIQTGPSHVIKSLNLPEKYQNGNLRISMGKWTQKNDLDYLIKILKKIL